MENKLQVVNQNQNIVLSEPEIQIAMQVYHINQLTAFPLADHQIDEWSKAIYELRPEVRPEEIKDVIDGMKQGYIEYDNRLGIQNIFKALDAGKVSIDIPS